MKTILLNNPLLNKRSEKVPLKKGLEIGRELFSFLRSHNRQNPRRQGIGLSAVQLGIDAAVCVIMLNKLQLVLVNPEIIEQSFQKIQFKEGCLSYPGIELLTERYFWVKVVADNLRQPEIFGVDLTTVTGKSYERMLLEGICVQHEVDHTQGITIYQRAI